MSGSAVDLHLHSTASDGRLDPSALVAHVAARGVRLMSLTDHDTIAGLAEASAAADAAGITCVTGIELSAVWRGRGIHILGYDFDPEAPAMGAMLAGQHDRRLSRARQIAARLDRARAPGQAALELALAATPLPTRTHFARALAELGVAPDAPTAFEQWLARGRPGYVTGEWPTVAATVECIVASGGAAVIAHPHRYTLSNGVRRELGTEFREAGGAGVEVATGGANATQFDMCLSLAVRCGLEGSAGSDFHDPAVPWNPPGRLAKLPTSLRPVWRRFRAPAGCIEQA